MGTRFRARCFNSDERGPTALEIVEKKILGSVDFRQRWRTRFAALQGLHPQNDPGLAGIASEEIAGIRGGEQGMRVDTAFTATM